MNSTSKHRRLPPAPTDALPGSKEKVRILAERARLGVSLWHPLDAKLPGDAESAACSGQTENAAGRYCA